MILFDSEHNQAYVRELFRKRQPAAAAADELEVSRQVLAEQIIAEMKAEGTWHDISQPYPGWREAPETARFGSEVSDSG